MQENGYCNVQGAIGYTLTAIRRKKQLCPKTVTDTKLNRCLNVFDLTLIGIGSTLGSGIYVISGEVARNKAGPGIVISFFIAAVASLLSGLCYAEFGSRIPRAGSAYVFCYLTFGEFVAFIIGWNMILEYIIGAAVIARGSSAGIDSLGNNPIQNFTISWTGAFQVTGIASYIDFFAFAICMMYTAILCVGVRSSSRLINTLVVINLLTIIAVIVAGGVYADTKNWTNFAPFGVQGIFSGASTCFFAFIGFDVIMMASEEAKDPGRGIPGSIFATICKLFCSTSLCITIGQKYISVFNSLINYTTMQCNRA